MSSDPESDDFVKDPNYKGSSGDPDEGAGTLAFLAKQIEGHRQAAEDEAWAEALRTGNPLKAPPGYEVVEEEVGVVGPDGKLLKTGGGS